LADGRSWILIFLLVIIRFEAVSDTNQLNTVSSREPPFGDCFVPDGTDLEVVEEADGFFGGHGQIGEYLPQKYKKAGKYPWDVG